MELPDWIADVVLARAKPAEVRLILALYRHGKPQVDGGGDRRVYLKASMQELSRMAGATKPHVIAAERTLASLGLVTIHNANRPGATHAISAPYDRAPGNNLLPPSEPANRTHAAGGDPDPDHPSQSEGGDGPTSPTTAREAICNRLDELGVNGARRLVAGYGTSLFCGVVSLAACVKHCARGVKRSEKNLSSWNISMSP